MASANPQTHEEEVAAWSSVLENTTTVIEYMSGDTEKSTAIHEECLQISHVFREAIADSYDPAYIEPLQEYREEQPMLMNFMDAVPFHNLMTCFGAWTYTGKIFRNSPWHVELWRFGQIIASPSFMNAVLKDLCTYISNPKVAPSSPSSSSTFQRPSLTADLVKRCWKWSHFMYENTDAIMFSMDWDNKKMLKFLVDIYAHKAIHEKDFKDDAGLKELLTGRDHSSGQLALQIARAIGARERVKKAPWHKDCIGEYLVNEDMPERRFESDCRWEAVDDDVFFLLV